MYPRNVYIVSTIDPSVGGRGLVPYLSLLYSTRVPSGRMGDDKPIGCQRVHPAHILAWWCEGLLGLTQSWSVVNGNRGKVLYSKHGVAPSEVRQTNVCRVTMGKVIQACAVLNKS